MSDRKVTVPRPLSREWIANAVPYGLAKKRSQGYRTAARGRLGCILIFYCSNKSLRFLVGDDGRYTTLPRPSLSCHLTHYLCSSTSLCIGFRKKRKRTVKKHPSSWRYAVVLTQLSRWRHDEQLSCEYTYRMLFPCILSSSLL